MGAVSAVVEDFTRHTVGTLVQRDEGFQYRYVKVRNSFSERATGLWQILDGNSRTPQLYTDAQMQYTINTYGTVYTVLAEGYAS